MKKAENKVKIEGILSEVDIKTGESKTDSKPYIMGEIKVKVEQETNGVPYEMEVPISMFATKYTKEGKINPAYESIEKISKECTSIAAAGGEENADRIRIVSGEIKENCFYNKNGALVSYARINSSFANRIKKNECTPEATFTGVIVIGNIKEEIDKNEEPTGRLIIQAIIPQYSRDESNPNVDMVTFYVASEQAIHHINTYWNKGDTVKIAGKVNYSVSTSVTYEEVGFGEPIAKINTHTTREFIITSGSPEGFDEEMAYKQADIKKGLELRQTRLEGMKDKSTSTATKPKVDYGF